MIRPSFLSLLISFLMIQPLQASNSCIMENFDNEVVNTADSLNEIEQADLTKDQCKIFQKEFKKRKRNKSKLSDPTFNRAKVLCGKWIFLNLGMKTKIGVPAKIFDLIREFPEVGKDLKGLGFLSDETWKKEWPFGIVKSSYENPLSFKRVTVNKIVQLSCAACHTGQLSDGRFSIGASNEQLEYGKFNVYTLYTIWLADKRKLDETRWLPELIEKYSNLKKLNEKGFVKTLEGMTILPVNDFIIKHLIGEEPPPLEAQRSFINTRAGIYNGFAPSLNFKDRQIYLTAPQLYGIGTEAEAHYGSLAGLKNIDDFINEAFVYTTRTTRYSKELYLGPVREYLKCLKAPENRKVKDVELFNKGKTVFTSSCTSCHDLKNGAGSTTVAPEIIKTPDSYLNLFTNYKPTEVQSKKTFKVIQKAGLDKSVDSIKVRRLSGIWTRKSLTSNGQVDDLDHLFCLNKSIRTNLDSSHPKTQGIHSDLCSDYSTEEKEALKEYLLYF